MACKLISTFGHMNLPLAVKIKLDPLDQRYIIEVWVAGKFTEDVSAFTLDKAREFANLKTNKWVEILSPVFDAGYNAAINFIAEGA